MMMSNGYGFAGGFMYLIFFILIVFLIWIFKPSQKKNDIYPYSNPTALEILKQRYAKGEIDLEEYNEKKQVLEQ